MVGNDGIELLGHLDISAHCFDRQRLECQWRLATVLVHVSDVLCQFEVVLSIGLVSDEPDQIKSRQQGGGQLDIVLD